MLNSHVLVNILTFNRQGRGHFQYQVLWLENKYKQSYENKLPQTPFYRL